MVKKNYGRKIIDNGQMYYGEIILWKTLYMEDFFHMEDNFQKF